MESLILAYNRRLEDTKCVYFRYLYSKIDWNERLVGIKGARGVGKTTLILQHIKRSFTNRNNAFYVSLDHIWFSTHTLMELTEYLYTHGVTHIFLDEVHRYPNWIREIKNIYDGYPNLHITFTGSSLLEIDNAKADLSRRLRMYHLEGLSFREYLAINQIADIPAVSLNEIITNHQQIASQITAKIKVLPHFEKYVQQGYYPFLLETTSLESYYERIQNVISTIIENDIPTVENIEYDTLRKAKRLLVLLAQMAPFTLNISSLCAALATTRNQLIKLLSLLHHSALLRLLYTEGKGLKALGKPEKILFNNPNLMQALTKPVDTGTLRESFFASMMNQSHSIQFPTQGDLLVDNRYLFEIGGRGKKFTQIKDIPDSFIAADEIEIGFGNKIPLWLFGMMY